MGKKKDDKKEIRIRNGETEVTHAEDAISVSGPLIMIQESGK